MTPREACPQCGSRWCKRNGHLHTGTPNHRCQAGSRAFGLPPDNSVITEEPRGLIARRLLERISRRGICRAVGVGFQWLLQVTGARFQAPPAHRYVKPADGVPTVILQRLAAKRWSFGGTKENRQGVWVARATTTRQVLAFHVGDRSRPSAKALWEKIPAG